MPTRNVVLTDHQASLVEQLVTSGRYQNASEVLREGLRLVEQRETEDAYRLEALRAAVSQGAADIEAGRFKSFESKASLRSHLKSITDHAIAKKWAEGQILEVLRVLHDSMDLARHLPRADDQPHWLRSGLLHPSWLKNEIDVCFSGLMKNSMNAQTLSISWNHATHGAGTHAHVAIARKRRMEPRKTWAQRIGVTEPTLARMEVVAVSEPLAFEPSPSRSIGLPCWISAGHSCEQSTPIANAYCHHEINRLFIFMARAYSEHIGAATPPVH